MREETMSQKIEREARDHHLYLRLTRQPNPYAEVCRTKSVKLDGEYFSPQWILLYAHARHSGITCMVTSCWVANERMSHREIHDNRQNELDLRLLEWAALYHLHQPRKNETAARVAA